MAKRVAQSNWACVSYENPKSSKDLFIIRVKEELGVQNQVTWLRPGDSKDDRQKQYIFKLIYGPVSGTRSQARKNKENAIKSLKLTRVTANDYHNREASDGYFSFGNQSTYQNAISSILQILTTSPPYTFTIGPSSIYATPPVTFSTGAGSNDSIAIGDGAVASNNDSIAIGDSGFARNSDSIAIGHGADVTDSNSVAIGKSNYFPPPTGSGGYITITGGTGGSTGAGGSITLTGGAGSYSYTSPTHRRDTNFYTSNTFHNTQPLSVYDYEVNAQKNHYLPIAYQDAIDSALKNQSPAKTGLEGPKADPESTPQV